MTFIELVEEVARKTGQSKSTVKKTLKTMAEVIEHEVFEHHIGVPIPGFGKFKLRTVKGGERRIGGALMHVTARDTLKFVAYAERVKDQPALPETTGFVAVK